MRTAMHPHQLERDQPGEVDFELGVAPAEALAQHAPGEADTLPGDPLLARFAGDVLLNQIQQPSCAWWQLVQRPSEHPVCEPVCDRMSSRVTSM